MIRVPYRLFYFIVRQGVENVGSLWVDAGDAWASRGGWDNNVSGEAIVCVYNSSDYVDNACGEVGRGDRTLPCGIPVC